MNAGPFTRPFLVTSISTTAMIGSGLSATPIASGGTCPIALPMLHPGIHHRGEHSNRAGDRVVSPEPDERAPAGGDAVHSTGDHLHTVRPREPGRSALLQLVRRAPGRRAGAGGAKDGHGALLRRGRVDRARRAARPRGDARADGPLLRRRPGAGRAARRHRREGDRRRAGGGVRDPGGARGRRAAGGAGGARDARRGAGVGEVQARIGVNTGDVLARDPTAGESLVVGDAVNVAARLEQAAAPGEVLVGEATWALVGHAARGERVAPIVAKGKREPLVAWRLESRRSRRPAGTGAGSTCRWSAASPSSSSCAGRSTRTEQAHRPHLVTILGQPGIGKSRLVSEVPRLRAGLTCPDRALPGDPGSVVAGAAARGRAAGGRGWPRTPEAGRRADARRAGCRRGRRLPGGRCSGRSAGRRAGRPRA